MPTTIDPSARFGFDVAIQGFNSRNMARLNALTADRFSGDPHRAKVAMVPHQAALLGLCAILTISMPKAGYTPEAKPMGALELNYQLSLGESAYQQATEQMLTSINCAMRAVPASFLVSPDLIDVIHSAEMQESPKKEEPPSIQKIEIVAQPPLTITWRIQV